MLGRSGHTDKADDRWATLCRLLPHYERELKRPHVTRQTLLEEYRQAYPEGYGKTQFFQYLREHLRLGQAYQPIEHKAGEKLFVDYAGVSCPSKPGSTLKQTFRFRGSKETGVFTSGGSRQEA